MTLQASNCRGRVLIAEDERITAADLRVRLTGFGYSVVASVASGEEAVERADELRPDIAIMDVRLRGPMDGVEAGLQISERWGTPVIFLSAFLDADIRRRSEAITSTYLAKPFDPEALESALDKVALAEVPRR